MGRTIQPSVRFTLDDPRIMPEPNTGCWLSCGAMSRDGYGMAIRDGRKSNAHRFVWERIIGAIPSGMVLDHMCRVRSCVNPDHLRVVTPRINVLENSLSHVAELAKRTACFRCGGVYTVRKCDGARVCADCKRIQCRVYQRRSRARKLGLPIPPLPT